MNKVQFTIVCFFVMHLWGLSSLADQKHRFIEFDQHVFLTKDQRQFFFKQLGLTYLNDIVVVSELYKKFDYKQLPGYKIDQEYNDRLTALYSGHIANQTIAPMSIRWINQQVGYGIFAESNMRKGDFIGLYGGIVIDQSLTKNKDYAWSFPMLEKEIILDAAEYGNEMSLINDGKDPNCMMVHILDRNGACYICYIAIRDIRIGEQFLISYGPGYWESRGYSYQEMGQ